jgi:bisphosphoglycerate-independent phosphoglycerate mutase (AlkP superfamily)
MCDIIISTKKESFMKPVVLCILDGVGINPNHEHNAVAMAKMPFFNELLQKYPHSELDASGGAVGLPDGVMGNSEDGHFTFGRPLHRKDELQIRQENFAFKFARH